MYKRKYHIFLPLILLLIAGGLASCDSPDRPAADELDVPVPFRPGSLPRNKRHFSICSRRTRSGSSGRQPTRTTAWSPTAIPIRRSPVLPPSVLDSHSWIIGVERGYVTREEAAEITRNTIRFFWEAPQGPEPEGTAGYRGFFYHFLDMETGTRYRTNELSTIDSALLVAGMLSSQQYFDRR
jgi:hypothetical protein